MPYTPNQVQMEGFPFGQFTFTYLLSGVAATDDAVAATAGKAVALDTAAAGTVKLAGNGERIFGRVYVAENRAVSGIRTASVARKFKERLPAAGGHGIVVGDRIVGAGAGLVKKATLNSGAGEVSDPIVVETGADYVIAEML
jgi:hypothetical protein